MAQREEATSWQELAYNIRFNDGKRIVDAVKAVKEEFPEVLEGLHRAEAYDKVRSYIRGEEIKRFRQGNILVVNKEVEKVKPQKTQVYQNIQPNVVQSSWSKERTIRFGMVGDTHFNSNWVQITHLHNLYDQFAKAGIKNVYHAGDIDEGEDMRKGHKYECYNQGSDDHVAEIVKNYPKRNGIETKFILGNHDASFIKLSGQDIGVAIAKERNDMIYLGRDNADIKLTPNCTLQLVHPWDGSAYALSYKMQKMLDAMSGGEKPNILAVGHYHKLMYIFYRNVHAFQVGTGQAQTFFMRGHSLSAMMGGWIVEVEVASDGTITRIYQECIPYYTAIKDDWKNWR